MPSYIYVLLLLTTGLFLSCSKDDNSVIPDPAAVSASLTNAGQWRVTLYTKDSKDGTSDFTGYVFEFKSGNVLTASRSGVLLTGYWKTATDSGKTKLVIELPENDPLEELNEDWEVILQQADKIRMKHISGGNGTTDEVEFTKI